MWMAQGFIQPQEGRNIVMMEDIGDKYFNILLYRSLFQDVVKDERGRITHCKMHDLIHEIACTMSHSKKLHSDAHADHLLEEGSCSNWRRKSVVNLRTFICNRQIPHETIHGKIANCVRLRVLVLNSYVKNLPDSIGKMKHLRYLDISDSQIKELPNSISLLYNLQTLKLGRLTKDFPKNLSKLISLRHLKFSIPFTEETNQMPPHLSRLTQLQTLSGFVVGLENGCKIEELGPLKNLKGRLELSNLEKIKSKEEAMTSKLVEKKNLRELFFEWDLHILREGSINNNNDLEVLEGLQPHENLQFLSIKNFAGQFLPSGIFVENLVVLHLRHCERCESLPMLGQLSNLEELNISSLNRVRSIGNEFYGNDANHSALFPKLKKFALSQMYSLEQWGEVVVASNDAIFPRLEDLNIRGCPKLTSIPNIFGSSSDAGIRSFRSLHIYGCEELTRLPNELCNSLEDLKIVGFLNLMLNVQNMHNLSRLYINGLRMLPEGLANLKNLKELIIIECTQDYEFSPLLQLPSLAKLHLVIFGASATEQLPQQLEHLIALKCLYINDFHGIEALPEWLQNFTSLEVLGLYNCRNLKRLPSRGAMQCLTKLSRLDVFGCPRLRDWQDFFPVIDQMI